MPDMLVKLYDLTNDKNYLKEMNSKGVIIKRALPPEKHIVLDWIEDHFSKGWASECEISFTNQPVSSFVAIKEGKIVGFACYNATFKDFFGPEGVQESYRGEKIGKALLLRCLQAMKAEGYGYAIIGGAGPTEFYKKVCDAEIIEDSTPGIYKDMLS